MTDLKIIPVSSYLEIAKVVDFLKSTIAQLEGDINEAFITWVGLASSGIHPDDLRGYKCRSNHYLKDALGVDRLPPIDTSDQNIDPLSISTLCASIKEEKSHPRFKAADFDRAVKYVCHIILDKMRELQQIRGSDKFLTPKHKSFLEENGYLIIPGAVTKEEAHKLSKLTLLIAAAEDQAGVAYRYGSEDNNLQRVYNLISKHPVYIELLQKPLVREILDFYFDRDNLHHKYVMSSFQSNIIHPGAPAQQLHVDGWSFSANPLPRWAARLNVNFLLTDWCADNGATMLLPGSHKLFRAPRPDEVSDEELQKVIAPKGSLVLWTGHTWHKSGANLSDAPRFGLFACFAASQLKELCTEEEHLSVVDPEVMEKLSPEFRFMIGLNRGIKKGAKHRVNFENTEFDGFSLEGDD